MSSESGGVEDAEYRKSLEKKLEHAWKEVRESFNYPQLPKPSLGDEVQEIEMRDHRIVISPDYVKDLEAKGLSEDETLKGILSHYVGHYFYKYSPWDFPHMLLTENEMAKIDEKKAEEYRNAYNDVCVDLSLMLKHRNNGVEKLLSRTWNSPVDRLLRAYYEEQTGHDMGIGAVDELTEKYVKRLNRIDFFDKDKWKPNARRFGNILKEYAKELEKAEGKEGKDGGKGGEGKGQGGKGAGQPMPGSGGGEGGEPGQGGGEQPDGEGDNGAGKEDEKPGGEGEEHEYSGCCGSGSHMGMEAFDSNDIKDGMRQLASGMSPEEFKKMMDRLRGKGKGKGHGKEAGIFGDDSFTLSDALYYKLLAENYFVGIKKKPNIRSDTMYPETHRKYEMGDPFHQIDFLNSYGKILPGITQRWQFSEMETFGKLDGSPDVLIVIDSSGSMTDPSKSLSYAVLGGFCTANAYLDNGSKAGVINFSGRGIALEEGFTDDREKVYEAMCKYFGDGTEMPLDEIKKMVEKHEKECDIVLISDTNISNLEETIGFLKTIKNKNRVTVLGIGSGNKMSKHAEKDFAVYTVDSPEKIPEIMIGEFRDYMGLKEDEKDVP